VVGSEDVSFRRDNDSRAKALGLVVAGLIVLRRAGIIAKKSAQIIENGIDIRDSRMVTVEKIFTTDGATRLTPVRS